MTEFPVHDRSRRAEDDYFRRRDAELLERARAARVRPEDAVLHEERHRLGEAIGLHDLDVIVPLHTAGVRAGNTDMIEWLPAVQVAWIDNVDMFEREELRRHFSQADSAGGASDLLMEWLLVRPPDETMMAARRALRHRLAASAPDSRRHTLMRVLERCVAVGRASGGVFGVGAISRKERLLIAAIRQDLTVAPPAGEPPVGAVRH